MRTIAILTLGLTALIGVGCGKSDKDAIQGTWAVESAEMDGNTAPADKIKDKKLVFTADKISYNDGKENGEEKYKLDPSAKPKAIDMTVTVEYRTFGKVGGAIGGPTQQEPPAVKKEIKNVKGIYSLEGDTLKMCFGDPETDRPTEFTSKDKRMLMVLKRGK